MSNAITFALLTSSLRLAWGVIRIGSVGQEWAMKAEWSHAIVANLSSALVKAGEALEAIVDRAATQCGLQEELLGRAIRYQL